MADCGNIAFSISPASLAFSSSLAESPPFPNYAADIVQFFSPFPVLPGNVELPPVIPPAATADPFDILSGLLEKMSPLFGALAPIFAVMKVIQCIIDVLCAIPNPFRMIRAVIILVTECLPPFIALLPPFYMAYLTITVIRIVVKLIIHMIKTIILIIKTLFEVFIKIIEFFRNLSKLSMGDIVQFIIKAACEVLNGLLKSIGILLYLGPIFAFIEPFLGGGGSAFNSRCVRSGSSADECPPNDEMTRFLNNPNDPNGFSFDPATTPISCYPTVQSAWNLIDARYNKNFGDTPLLPNPDDLYQKLEDVVNGLLDNDPDVFVDNLNNYFNENGVTGEPFVSILTNFKNAMKCTLYASACNVLDQFSSTFEANKISAFADGEDYVTLTITPRTVAGDPVGPVGIEDIPSPYQPAFVTDLGEIFDIEETVDGSFVAKIKSTEVGLATICPIINCVKCSEAEIDVLNALNEDGYDGYDAEDEAQILQYTITMKSIDGTIIQRNVVSLEQVIEDVETLVPLAGLAEVEDGYEPLEYEVDTEEKCILINFVPPEIISSSPPAACE